MPLFNWLIAACWLIFIVVWIVSAAGAKRTVRRNYAGVIYRIVTLLIIIFAVSAFGARRFLAYASPEAGSGALLGAVGVILCAGGVAFAVWARFYLGRNWGMPMSVKENPELVTTGPYAHVRHPIYTGVIFAMLGSCLAAGWIWLLWFIVIVPYFIYSATQEEKLLAKTFPEAYPAYKKRTKMLIPFVF